MPTATYGVALAAGGVSIQKSVIRSADSQFGHEVTINHATALVANSWVKTDANTAAGNMANGHGLANGTYDCYWNGGIRYGVGGTVTVDAMALEGGAGTDFPANGTAVTICEQKVVNSAIDGDAAKIVGVSLEFSDSSSTAKGHVDCQDSGNASIAALNLAANTPLIYDIDGGSNNPFTGNAITKTVASHDDTVNAATLKIVGVVDSTP